MCLIANYSKTAAVCLGVLQCRTKVHAATAQGLVTICPCKHQGHSRYCRKHYKWKEDTHPISCHSIPR